MHRDAERNLSIDVLRVIGGLVVMSAHVKLPPWLFQLRNFGAPMLVVVSALAMQVVHGRQPMDAVAFLRRRLPKLTLQPWAFLAIFFVCAEVAALVAGRSFPFSRQDVLDSFTFSGGIGYLWIFRVYILVALITPPMLHLYGAAPSQRAYLAGVAIVYAVGELMRVALHAGSEGAYWLETMDDTVFTPLPYVLLFAYGLALPRMNDGEVRAVALGSTVVFAVLALAQFVATGAFVPTQAQKYPPTAYYLSYAFACIHLVYLALRDVNVSPRAAPAIVWLSSHMLWIYLWHVLALFAWGVVFGQPTSPSLLSAVELLVVIGAATGATWLQLRASGWWRAGMAGARMRTTDR
ncbi:acyltransferase [uncultured Piscinibacter sp.]|uniref:acyltransferase family protein n=1 Tax=uncultured Piscinibacter sp. TaxID=1131835 RepID=UPI00262BB07B|nr:acyltransferase [uncultured Piscinibacter sp.]